MNKATAELVNRAHHPPTPQIKIGVMGGAAPILSPDHLARAHRLGRAIAERGCALVTGACPGLPLAAACGCKSGGGTVLGISPAMSQAEHVERFRSPVEFHDFLVYTGHGLMGREVINIRTSDAVVIVGGRTGTLGELAIAYDEGKPIGVLTHTGGISDLVSNILTVCGKETGAKVVYSDDPVELIDQLLASLREVQSRPAINPSDTPPSNLFATDPVCGMKIVAEAAVTSRFRDGKEFRFCSQECANVFDGQSHHSVTHSESRGDG